MLIILAVWAISISAAFGYGYLWNLIADRRQSESAGYISVPVDCLIAGLSLLCGLTVLAGSFFPLAGVAGILILSVGVIACMTVCVFRFKIGYVPAILFFSLTAILIACPLSTTSWSDVYDSDLYHFQQVKWLREQGTPLGLANLHVRFGVSTSYLSLAAALEQYDLKGRSAWFMPGLFPLITFIWAVLRLKSTYTTEAQKPVLFYVLAILPFIFKNMFDIGPGLYFDSATGLVQIMLVGELLLLVVSGKSDQSAAYVKNIFFLAGLAVTLKFSSIYIAVLAPIIAIYFTGKVYNTALIAYGILLSVHFLRTVLLTGWILFPTPLGNTHMFWSMPENPLPQIEGGHGLEMQSVKGHMDIVKAWARLPGPQYRKAIEEGMSAWFPGWSDGFKKTMEAKMLPASVVLVLVSFLSAGYRKIKWQLIIYCLIGLGSIAFWFSSAPDLRFGAVLFAITMALGFAAGMYKVLNRNLVSAAMLVFLVYTYKGNLLPGTLPEMLSIGRAAGRPVAVHKLKSGLQVRITPAGEDRCGNSRLPCTPYLQDSLIYKKSGKRFKWFAVGKP